MNFAVVFGASLWSGYALPACHPENGTTTATGRGSTYQARKPVQTKPATSITVLVTGFLSLGAVLVALGYMYA